MNVQHFELGGARLTRVPHLDLPVPPELVGLSGDDVAANAWAEPTWVENGQVRVGAAIWIADVDGQRIAFDPMLAVDVVLRADAATERAQQEVVAATLAQAGFPRESIDLVLLSHIEGVGMVAWRDERDAYGPFFPNAQIRLSRPELEAFAARTTSAEEDLELAAYGSLQQLGLLDTFEDGDQLTGSVSATVHDNHAPGHAVFHLHDDALTMLGHLAVSPLHLVTGPCAALHLVPEASWDQLKGLKDGRVLVGPLWPSPGFGRWRDGALQADAASSQT